ncbi:putative bifunctional diguanylate cyclase/phosphodiesterase [Sulfuricystis multivorans]|uniref:putative bifunctional diguanylate cyclase/phosphodiesterase n=1 Tax=Sulfuricystis multivorans TaxID=2211108 RepID=UPI000F8285C2|nr:EAL domain-containing protein [Sulfuricystis multivorans]
MDIFLIEDNPGDARLIGLFVDEARANRRLPPQTRLIQADTLTEGLLRVAEADVILLDLSLPDSFGRATFERLRHAAPQIPVVVLTGLDDEALAAELVAAGAQDYLVKGMIDERHLARALRYAIERKRAEEEIRRLAYHDALTGLPNRLLFRDRFEQAQAWARRNRERVAVLLLDLDRFKHINDTLGHAVGDELLKAVADRLVGAVRETDTVARLGGDEFAVIVGDIHVPEDAAQVAAKIRAALAAPFHFAGRELFVDASIGIAIHDPAVASTGEAAPGLLERADVAMYHAKRRSLGHAFFDTKMFTVAEGRLDLEADLRHALRSNQFVLHYQPQIECNSRRVIGVEALLRWHHPSRGLIAPDAFVPLLEETGLIVPVGEWVLVTACHQAKAWDAAGLPPLRMAINLSVRQLREPDFIDRVAAVIAASGLPPQRLEFELTESMVMENADIAGGALARLKTLGCRIALDDFGTGASSLGYLMHLPVDTLKISSAIIYQVEDQVDAAIASAVIGMAQGMSLESVAEGVETEAQLNFLRRSRCSSVQGYLLGRPMPADAFVEWQRWFTTVR